MYTLLLAGSLSVMIALESTAIKYVEQVQLSHIPSEQLVFIVEVVKLVVSALIYHFNKTTYLPLEERVHSGLVWFLLPAGLWAVSNNIVFLALEVMSPAMFNLLMNLKIPLTALFAWAFIQYKVTGYLLLSFVLLFLGSAFASFNFTSLSVSVSLVGLLGMLVYCSCSASAAVYCEYVTKIRFPDEDLFLQNIKFCFCSALVNAGLILFRWKVPFTQLEWVHLLTVSSLVMNGLLTAAVIKHSGSIVKTYSVSVAMFLSALLTLLVFHKALFWNFYVGGIVCIFAVNLYAWEKQTLSTQAMT